MLVESKLRSNIFLGLTILMDIQMEKIYRESEQKPRETTLELFQISKIVRRFHILQHELSQ